MAKMLMIFMKSLDLKEAALLKDFHSREMNLFNTLRLELVVIWGLLPLKPQETNFSLKLKVLKSFSRIKFYGAAGGLQLINIIFPRSFLPQLCTRYL